MGGVINPEKATVRVRGHEVAVNLLTFLGQELVITGRLMKMARLKDEWYQPLSEPMVLIESLVAQRVRADAFTFIQMPPDCVPRYSYHMEWDNVAAIPLQGYEHWWQKQIGSKTRALVRKSAKSGIQVRTVEFDDDLIRGIEGIYNETPVRQGKLFWHYKKDFDYLRRIHETYLDRSEFIGAYFKDELVGFIKLVYSGDTGNLMHIISKNQHRDKAVTNALVAKAVEICCAKGCKYLAYDKFDYGAGGSPTLLLFKRNNGFSKLEYPRYYVPLTQKGRVAIGLGIHRGLVPILPRRLVEVMVTVRNEARAKWYEYRYGVR